MAKYEDNFDPASVKDTKRITAIKYTIDILENKRNEFKNTYNIYDIESDGSSEYKRGVITKEQYEEIKTLRLAIREARISLREYENNNKVIINDTVNEKERVHESYGMISLSRTMSSHDTPFFGSKLKCKSFMTIRIRTGSHKRSLNTDWYHGQKEIIEIRLTPSQFSEFITGANMGDGFPCTIGSFMGRMMDEPPYYSQVEEFDDEFEEKIKGITQDIRNLDDCVHDLNATGNISKKKREEIAKMINKVSRELHSNIPYLGKCFSEHMDKTTSEFKQEAEAFLNSMITRAGIESLQRDNFPSIENESLKSLDSK